MQQTILLLLYLPTVLLVSVISTYVANMDGPPYNSAYGLGTVAWDTTQAFVPPSVTFTGVIFFINNITIRAEFHTI